MILDSAFLTRLADAAAAETLPRFRSQVGVDNKLASGFDPVTEADRKAERAIRDVIRAAFPEHGIVGEEYGSEQAGAEHVWVIDPIDGTRSFISGIPLWGTLIGLLRGGDAVAGVMAQPFTGELFWALEGQAFWRKGEETRRLATRATGELSEATLCTTTPTFFSAAQRRSYDAVERRVRLARYGTDCYAYAMLAAGQVDLVIEAGLQPYDVVALIPIVEAAGGVMSDWEGGPAEAGGAIVAAATPALHEATLKLLAGGDRT